MCSDTATSSSVANFVVTHLEKSIINNSRVIRACADRLCGVVRIDFPTLWNTSCLVPVPKSAHLKELSDYRLVALTSQLMKTLERLILAHLRPLVNSAVDPLQVCVSAAYVVDDAVIYTTHTAM